jgi:hypothetical protein
MLTFYDIDATFENTTFGKLKDEDDRNIRLMLRESSKG